MSTGPNTHLLGDVELDTADGSRTVTMTVGLDDSPEIRSSMDAKSQQDGLWDAVPLYGGRTITLDGFVEESSSAAAHQFVAGMRALGRKMSTLVVSSPGRGEVSAQVRVQSGVTVQWITDRALRYAITLLAPDPLLYGPEVFAQAPVAASGGSGGRTWPRTWPTSWGVAPGVTPGAVTLANGGTAGYFPRVRLSGYLVNPVLTVPETGDWVRVGRTIEAGQHVDINWGVPRRVTVGDNPISIRPNVTYSGNFLAIPAGGASLTISADDASDDAVLSVWSYESAWE